MILFFFVFLMIVMSGGCFDQSDQLDTNSFQIEIVEINTRCGYHNVIYRDSVLNVVARISNPDVKPGSMKISFFIDEFLEETKTISLNESEERLVTFSNIDENYVFFPLPGLHLDTAGGQVITVGDVSMNITVHDPVLDVSLKSLEWKTGVEGYNPWLTLEIVNPTNYTFYLGGSFGLVTDEAIYAADVESWQVVSGVESETGFYKLESDATVAVEIARFELSSSQLDGSDVSIENLYVYAGFPWLDFTGGIIGEIVL